MAKKKATVKAAESTDVPAGMKSNSALIREMLDAGITKPADLVLAIKEKHGADVSSALVNQVKQKWKKDQGEGAKIAMKRGPKAKNGGIVDNGMTASAGTDDTVRNGRLSELDVAKFALKMGGVDAAIAALRDLVK